MLNGLFPIFFTQRRKGRIFWRFITQRTQRRKGRIFLAILHAEDAKAQRAHFLAIHHAEDAKARFFGYFSRKGRRGAEDAKVKSEKVII